MEKGLYSSAYEHDACGVGMVVNIHGNKSHELVDNALKVLENMRHRGAEGADNKTGDGAGIMGSEKWSICFQRVLLMPFSSMKSQSLPVNIRKSTLTRSPLMMASR